MAVELSTYPQRLRRKLEAQQMTYRHAELRKKLSIEYFATHELG